jgi:hypothetical protein
MFVFAPWIDQFDETLTAQFVAVVRNAKLAGLAGQHCRTALVRCLRSSPGTRPNARASMATGIGHSESNVTGIYWVLLLGMAGKLEPCALVLLEVIDNVTLRN